MINLGEVITGLLEKVEAPSKEVRQAALEACRKLSTLARPGDLAIQRRLARMAKSRIPEAIMAVGALAVPDEDVFQDLKLLTDHADTEIKAAAIVAMGDYLLPLIMQSAGRPRPQQPQGGGQIIVPQVGIPPIPLK